ncbi:hypothetical protein LTR66_008696 [Elasticomyces elasticus]|nr:hypothetical protein LTR66_008696 [Elasticomyces elasticus]
MQVNASVACASEVPRRDDGIRLPNRSAPIRNIKAWLGDLREDGDLVWESFMGSPTTRRPRRRDEKGSRSVVPRMIENSDASYGSAHSRLLFDPTKESETNDRQVEVRTLTNDSRSIEHIQALPKWEKERRQFHVATDIREALQAALTPYAKSGQYLVQMAAAAIKDIQKNRSQVRLTWVPAHSIIPGNAAANLAALETTEPQAPIGTTSTRL